MKRALSFGRVWLCWAVLLVVCGVGQCPALAQPTLQAEARQPIRYQRYLGPGREEFTFALPGRRYLRCGTYDERSTLQYTGIMLALTKQNGDTVRYMVPRAHPGCRCQTFVKGAVLNPDHTLTVACLYVDNPPTAASRDSLLLFCLDTLGTIHWRRAYRFGNTFGTGHLLRTGDGYLLVSNQDAFPGSTGPGRNASTPAAIKFDLRGGLIWNRPLPTRGYANIGSISDLIACPDGSYLAFGNTDDNPVYVTGSSAYGRLDYFAVKFSSTGDTLRSFRFGTRGLDEYGLRLLPTADGGYAATGFRYRAGAGGVAIHDGQVFKLDSLFRPQWSQTHSWLGTSPYDWYYYLCQPLANGDVLAGGFDMYPIPTYPRIGGKGQLTCYQANGTLRWDWQHQYQNYNGTGFTEMVNNADGSALLLGAVGTGASMNTYVGYAYSAYLTNVGIPYVPDLCATPPQAALSPGLSPNRDSLLCFDLSAPGPRYGVLTAWHWSFGDGSTFDGPTPPWHRYAAVPPPGTPVTLTVTNNLGCTHTHTAYPWGPLSTARQVQALQAGATLFPNPATDRVTLAVPNWPGTAPVPVQVLDALGRVVAAATARPAGGTLTVGLALAGLPTGVYAVRVLAPQGSLTKRLVRE